MSIIIHDTSPKRRVPALERGVAILDLLCEGGAPLGVSEIARALSLAKSTVHGLCEALRDLGLVRLEAGGYVLGPASLRWSGAFLARSNLVQEFHHIVAAAPKLRDYTLTLSSLVGDQVSYLACHDSNRPLGINFHAGMSLPAVFTATGKAMLASLAPDALAARLQGPWPQAYTDAGVKNLAALQLQLAQVRATGYAVDDGEIRQGMVCLGVSISVAEGEPLAAIALSMTSIEATASRLEELGAALVTVAQQMRRA